jgi:hypothetical protein
MEMRMSFARWVFRLAALYGFLVLVPLYGLEARIGRETPPAITHPEYYYGFIGVALVMQLLYLLIASNPARYRPIMLIAVLGKLSFGLPMVLLYAQGRVAAAATALASADLVLGLLFAVAYLCTAAKSATSSFA